MDREEAVALLKELLFSFDELQTRSFALLPPSAFNIASQGYKIYLKDDLEAYTIAGIKEIAQKYDLKINEVEDRYIIYKAINEGLSN